MSKTILLFLIATLSCGTTFSRASDFGPEVLVSARDQEMAVVDNGKVVAKYRISTSKFGLGDEHGSYKTPLGVLWVCNKIGENLAPGTVIKNRNPTGEVVTANAPGRDPIVTRVIWLRGLEDQNRNAYDRCIYIHGTPEERLLGKKASFGCIRMGSKDISAVFGMIRVGTHVTISDKSLSKMVAEPPDRFASSN